MRRAPVWLLLAVCLAAPARGAGPEPAVPAGDAAALVAQVREGLDAWEALEQEIGERRREARALELAANPEGAESNWWNPFWRAAAERRLRRVREITLQLRDLDARREALAGDLMPAAAALAEAAVPGELAPGLAELRRRADAWRVPRLLEPPPELDAPPDLDGADRAWLAFRLKRLEGIRDQWRTLRDYLARRAADLPGDESYASWLARVTESLARLQPLLERMRARLPVPEVR